MEEKSFSSTSLDLQKKVYFELHADNGLFILASGEQKIGGAWVVNRYSECDPKIIYGDNETTFIYPKSSRNERFFMAALGHYLSDSEWITTLNGKKYQGYDPMD